MKKLLAASLLLLATAAHASPGRVTGLILDPAGEPIEGAQVTVRAREIQMVRSATSDKKGRYSLTLADATRTFDISIVKEGYAPIEEPINPVVGGMLRQNFVLQPGGGSAAPPPEELARIDSRNEAAKIYNAGAQAFEAGDLAGAAAKFREAVEVEPDLPLAWAALARVELERKEWESARLAALEVRRLTPNEPLGLRMHYDALWGGGRRGEAEALLEELVAAEDLESASIRLYNIGVEAVKVQDWAKAKASFQRTVELDPNLHLAYLTLSQIQVNQGEYAEALANAERFLATSPDDPRGLQVVFNAYRGLGETEKADAAYAQLSAAAPDMVADALMVEGRANFNNGNVAAATGVFERILQGNPDHPKAHYMLGLCYASGGNLASAKSHLSRFLELAPDDPEAELARQMLASL
jgi:tetratricopeptide (TPR) repeat protein